MIRRFVKRWLYGYCPGFAGAFPYFGVSVHFPKGSLAFRAACEQGIFEASNLSLLQQYCCAGTVMFDIGANLGLMAIPVLRVVAGCRVVSFEPSPNTLPWLRRTVAESDFGNRWQLVEKAVAAAPGVAEFSVSNPRDALFDGLKSTQRVSEARRVSVNVTTVDIEWECLGRPIVSVVKIDVEGAELSVLHGAVGCIGAMRPHILVEWNRTNLRPYAIPSGALFDFADTHRYRIYALPHLILVNNTVELELHLTRTESFLLVPA